jgi:hypothetical protein
MLNRMPGTEDLYAIIDWATYRLVGIFQRPEAFRLLFKLGKTNDRICAVLVPDDPDLERAFLERLAVLGLEGTLLTKTN